MGLLPSASPTAFCSSFLAAAATTRLCLPATAVQSPEKHTMMTLSVSSRTVLSHLHTYLAR